MPVTRLAVQPIMTMKDKKDRASPFIVKWRDASKHVPQQPIHVTIMEETTRPEGGHTAEAQTITQEQTRDDVQVGETMSGGQEVNMIELCDRSVAPWEGEGDGDLSDTTTISVDTYTMDSETNSMDQSLPTEGLDSPRGVLTAWVQTEAGEGEPSRGQDKSDSDVPEHQNPPRTPGSGNGSRAVVVTNPLMASPGQALLTSLSPAVPQPGPPGQVTHSPLYPSINMPSLGSASQHRLVPEVPNAVPDPSTPEFPSSPSPAIFTISGDDKSPLYWDEACVIEMRILQKTELPNGAPLTEGGPPLAERCDSTLSSLSEKLDICRICHCEGEESNKLISPCLCSGSLKFIHLTCLQKWIKSSDKKACELCNFDYIMTTKTRPFKQWEKLEMTAAERRKIVCSVTFHIIAITCVIWSLYVLIDRSTEEVHSGTLDWPFWTKLIVVAIGFTGGLVFMYVQCKMYVQLCFRWRQFNKLINIENAPEDPDLRAEAAARIKAKSNEKAGVVNTVALAEVDSF